MTTNEARIFVSELGQVVPEVSQNWVNKNIAAQNTRNFHTYIKTLSQKTLDIRDSFSVSQFQNNSIS